MVDVFLFLLTSASSVGRRFGRLDLLVDAALGRVLRPLPQVRVGTPGQPWTPGMSGLVLEEIPVGAPGRRLAGAVTEVGVGAVPGDVVGSKYSEKIKHFFLIMVLMVSE